MRRYVRMGLTVAIVLVFGTVMLGANADASSTQHVRTITTSSAGPSVPFQAFDTTPKAFDLDGDGVKEIIVQNDNRYIYVFDSKTGALRAELKPSYPHHWGARPLNSAEATTFTVGSTPHIVVANSAAYVSVFRYDGKSGGEMHFTKMWERRLTDCHGDPGMDAMPVLADLDGDGRMEILAQTEESGVYALRADGSIFWKQCIWGGNGEPAVGDLDHDGTLDVVWASDGGVVTAMDGRTGKTKWTFWASAHRNVGAGSMPVGPTIAQVDGVGPLDVVVGARDSHDAENYENNHAALFVIKGNGQLMWARQNPNANPLTYTHPVVYDVDNDGVQDVLWGDWNTQGHKPGNWEVMGPANFYRWDATGKLQWRTQLDTYWSNKDIPLADVDGDGVQEVIANAPCGAGDGIWYLDSRTGKKESCFSTHPWKVSRAPVVYDLWGTGTMQLVIPVTAATSSVSGGAIMIYDTHQRYSSAWPHPPAPGAKSGPAPPPAEFAATFTPRSQDNNWWVEVHVDANRPLDRVVAVINGGEERHRLAKNDWGTWSKSFHAPDGTQIQFRARDSDGNVVRSSTYTWGSGTGGGGGAFDATFSPRAQGNDWWIETAVKANQPIDTVHVRLDGGPWQVLPRTDWGTWAKSLHAPDGTQVQFRATSTSGERDTSTTYTW